jgi:intracellular septation protein
MKNLALAGKGLLLDFASTIFFFTLYALTGNLTLSVTLGIALALTQCAWRLARRQIIDTMQWISLVMVVASGGAALATHNPVFVMLKPSIIYLLTGCAMLQRGWMLRYMPPRVLELMSDLVITSGYAWAGLMFVSALVNLAVGLNASVLVWGTAMTAWSIGSKTVMFFGQYAVMRHIGRRRARAAGLQRNDMLVAA